MPRLEKSVFGPLKRIYEGIPQFSSRSRTTRPAFPCSVLHGYTRIIDPKSHENPKDDNLYLDAGKIVFGPFERLISYGLLDG